jgi:hypothetical protein
MTAILDPIDLESFLKLGYFLRYRDDLRPVDFSRVDRTRYDGWKERDLVQEGRRILRDAIVRDFEPGRRNVLPLSGGLDSRAILAVLLECTNAADLRTYTFGTPGTLDYDLGNRVAAAAGTSHTPLPLTEHRYSMAELEDLSRRVRGQTFLFHHPPLARLDEVVAGGDVWSGYIGDFFVGSHLPRRSSATIAEARARFLAGDRYVRSMELAHASDAVLMDQVEVEGIDPATVSLDERIFTLNHIRKSTAPHVLLAGHRYRTPLLDSEWVGFSMSLPEEHRRGLRLWKKILLELSPTLFSLPSKSNFGQPLSASRVRVLGAKARRRLRRRLGRTGRVDPNVNYLDFDHGFRSRGDLRAIARATLADLAARKLIDGIDVEDVLARHERREGDFADALIVLISLEVHLRTGASALVADRSRVSKPAPAERLEA